MDLINFFDLNSGEKIELFKVEGNINYSKNILIIGVFHGEEPQGYFAIKDFFFNKKNIVSKNNLLNRNFPTKNWQKTSKNSEYYGGESPSSEEETKFVVNIIEKIKPDFILTLHSPYSIVNYDGPGKNEAAKISELTNYPVQKDIGYPTPGSFGTYCGVERNIPTITLEFDENENQKIINKKSAKIFEWLMEEY